MSDHIPYLPHIPHVLAAASTPALSAGGAGLSLGGAAVLLGIAAALHHRRKSPRIIGWLVFLAGIPLAALFAGPLAALGSLTFWSIPAAVVATAYVGTVWFHDAFRRGGGGGGFGGGPHRWLHPLYGLILPALLLTLGGTLGHGMDAVLAAISHGAGTLLSHGVGK